MAERVTIFDLARELGISKTTVADALAGSGRVSPRTRERVRAAAAEHGYVSNRVAANLRRRSTGALGLYVPPIVRAASFYMDFALGGAERAADDGYDLTLFAQRTSRDGGFAVDGAVVIDPLPGDELVTQLLASGRPVVTAGPIGGRVAPHAVIEIPHRDLATRMFDLLRGNGARRVGFVSGARDFPVTWTNEITAAYDAWCVRVGQHPAAHPVAVEATDHELRAAVDDLLDRSGADALVFAAETWAARAKAMLTARGITVGRAFQVGSLSGDPVIEAPDRSIAHLDLGARTFGAAAFGLLMEVVTGAAARDAHRTHHARLVPADLG